MRIKWLGHASFELETDGTVIHVDPYINGENMKLADMVLITHHHFDHCDKDVLALVSKGDTRILWPTRVAKKLGRLGNIVGAGDFFTHKNVEVQVVPAYSFGSEIHPKGHGVGYVIDVGGLRVYHAGDTDHIPEMNLIEDVDVALLPVGGPHTMDPEGVVGAVQSISPMIMVPMHYGHFRDSVADIEDLRLQVEGSSSTRLEDLSNNDLHL